MKQIKIAMLVVVIIASLISFNITKTQVPRKIKFTIYAVSTIMFKTTDNDVINKTLVFEKPIQVMKVDDSGIKITKIIKRCLSLLLSLSSTHTYKYKTFCYSSNFTFDFLSLCMYVSV